MSLDFPTLGLVLVAVGFLSTVVMTTIWRLYRQEQGPAWWASAALLMTLGFLPLWLRPRIGDMAIILANVVAIGSPLLILEGVVRFRGLSMPSRLRLGTGLALFFLYMLASVVFLDDARHRYMINDLLMMVVLGLTILALLWRESGENRAVALVISFTFAIMILAFGYRWVLSLTSRFDEQQYIDRMMTIIYFTLVPWAIGWNYGFILAINSRSRKALHESARKDPLTGLYNRLWMTEHVEDSLGERDSNLSLAILDIDGFKRINDLHGHLFGDAVLNYVADSIREHLPANGSGIRYGGDEFILLFSCEGDCAQKEKLLDSIIERIGQPCVINGIPLEIKLSCGTATYPRDGESMDELFRVADQRMYEKKRKKTGRS